MAIAGGYLLTNQVTVTSNSWHIGGYNAFGLSLIPLILGIGILFFNGHSPIGWLLTFAGCRSQPDCVSFWAGEEAYRPSRAFRASNSFQAARRSSAAMI